MAAVRRHFRAAPPSPHYVRCGCDWALMDDRSVQAARSITCYRLVISWRAPSFVADRRKKRTMGRGHQPVASTGPPTAIIFECIVISGVATLRSASDCVSRDVHRWKADQYPPRRAAPQPEVQPGAPAGHPDPCTDADSASPSCFIRNSKEKPDKSRCRESTASGRRQINRI